MGEVRVLHCLNSSSWGGLEIYSSELIAHLGQKGVQQAVLCPADSRAAIYLKSLNIEIIPTPGKKISKLAHARLIRRLTKHRAFTHFHCHTRLDMWAAALAKWNTPQVKLIYNLYMNALPKQDPFHRWLFSKINALCSSSENILADAKKNFPIPHDRLHLVRYGRETTAYVHSPEKRQELRKKMNVADGQWVLGTLCRIDPGKGVRELVESLDHLSDDEVKQLQLWIVGEPTLEGHNADGQPRYESSSKELSDWIDLKMMEPRLSGVVKRIGFQKEYIPFLDAMDIFALASYNETYSLSILDAMLMEKPVIGTNAAGTPEQIGLNERGTLVAPKSSTAIAAAIRTYLTHPQTIREQGAFARSWVLSNHSWEKTLQQTLDLYQSV